MNALELIDRQLGPSAALITAADRLWLMREQSIIAEVSRILTEVPVEPMDFSAMSVQLPPAPE